MPHPFLASGVPINAYDIPFPYREGRHPRVAVFRMLEDAIGPDAFSMAMSEFWSAQKEQRQGWEDLAKAVQKYAPNGFDAQRFLGQWLTGKQAPRLTAEVRGSTVTLHADLPGLRLDMTVNEMTSKDREHPSHLR